MIQLSNTDTHHLIRLLESCSGLIDKFCQKPCEQDKARQCRKMIKKLKNKIDNEKV